MGAEFRPNRAGIEAMLRSPTVVRALEARAEQIKRRAERISPVDTGHYKASWYRETHATGDGRPFVRVGNRCSYGRYLEFGTSRMRKQRILGRALDAINLA